MADLKDRIANLMGNVSPQKSQGIMRLNQGGMLQRAEPINIAQPAPIKGDPFGVAARPTFGRLNNSAMSALQPVGNFIKNRIGANEIQPTLQSFAQTIDQKFPAKQGSGIGSIGIGPVRPPMMQPLPMPINQPISQPLPNVPQPVQQIQGFAEGGDVDMSPQQGMAEIEMSKEEAMQEIFIPLAENGYEKEVMAILNNPIDSEISMQAQQVIIQVLSQDPEFDMDDFQMALTLVAPQ
tara:strand:- start:1399 stop:2109 length:711 start_codon:yes stop_codon:yes gene_type:complete